MIIIEIDVRSVFKRIIECLSICLSLSLIKLCHANTKKKRNYEKYKKCMTGE